MGVSRLGYGFHFKFCFSNLSICYFIKKFKINVVLDSLSCVFYYPSMLSSLVYNNVPTIIISGHLNERRTECCII